MKTQKNYGGFSLVELMIALTLSSLIAIGMVSVYLSSKESYRLQESVSRRLENGRYALTILQRDIRAASYRGCQRAVDVDSGAEITANLLDTTVFRYNFTRSLEGFNANAADWTPALDGAITNAVPGSDVITVRIPVDIPGTFVTKTMDPDGDAAVTVAPMTPALVANDLVMISDCLGAAIFKVTGVTNNAGNAAWRDLAHVHQGAGTPVNAGTGTLPRIFSAGAQLARISTVTYYIRNSANGTGPALWQLVQNPAGTTTSSNNELAEGIENLQIQYGIDTNGDIDPDSWVNASTVTAAQWPLVIAVRLALLAASTDAPNRTEPDTRQFNLLGTTVGPAGGFTDGRTRRIYTSTITLRNRSK